MGTVFVFKDSSFESWNFYFQNFKDAGINTDKIMNTLSAQLKSLLEDAIKEMDGLDETAVELRHQLDAEKRTTKELQIKNDKLETNINVLHQNNVNCQAENKRLNEK